MALAAVLVLALAVSLWPRGKAGPTGLQLDARLYRQGSQGAEALETGAVIEVGDQLFLEVHGEDASHVYVLDEDAQGVVTVLFPIPGGDLTNPLAGGTGHRLPGSVLGRSQDWQVTSAGGQETILILASREPVDAVERAVHELPTARVGQPLQYGVLDGSAVESLRSIAGITPSPVDTVARPGALARMTSELEMTPGGSPSTYVRWVTLHHR